VSEGIGNPLEEIIKGYFDGIVKTSVSDPDPHSICLLDPDPAADKISSKSQKIHII
jgi:hypothetical protein